MLNRTWALDFMEDSLYGGRRFRVLNVIDEGNLMDFHGTRGWPVGKGERERVRWQGKGNAYAGLQPGLAAWNAELAQPAADSREVSAVPFGWRMDTPGELA